MHNDRLNHSPSRSLVQHTGRLLLGGLFLLAVSGLGLASPVTVDENLVMGNPSGASNGLFSSGNYLMVKKEYDLSYNKGTADPNWVSWHLNSHWIGNTPRKNVFKADASLPKDWFTVRPADYAGTGFDKGHMCNFKDRSATAAASANTFLMTNMVPQSPKNNEHTWKSLEDYCRVLAKAGNELYIVCGPEGKGGVGSKSPAVKTELDASRPNGGSGKIVVPNETWKVVLILPKGKTSPKDVTAKARTIAVIMPNTQNLENDWKSSKGNYICTISDVEKLTGYKFFSEVDATVAKALKSQKYAPGK